MLGVSVSVPGQSASGDSNNEQMKTIFNRQTIASLQARSAKRSGLIEVPWSKEEAPILYVCVHKKANGSAPTQEGALTSRTLNERKRPKRTKRGAPKGFPFDMENDDG